MDFNIANIKQFLFDFFIPKIISPNMALRSLSTLPREIAIDRGSDRKGNVRLLWDLTTDGQNAIDSTAVVALALNEAGRDLGYGMVYWVDVTDSQGDCLPHIPKIFYVYREWTEQEKSVWDDAGHARRLRMISFINRQDCVLPVRVLLFDKPQSM